jgi:hypothetical protein
MFRIYSYLTFLITTLVLVQAQYGAFVGCIATLTFDNTIASTVTNAQGSISSRQDCEVRSPSDAICSGNGRHTNGAKSSLLDSTTVTPNRHNPSLPIGKPTPAFARAPIQASRRSP